MSETSELIEELRWFLDSDWPHQKALHATVTKAASLLASQAEEIERLRAENDQINRLQRPYVDALKEMTATLQWSTVEREKLKERNDLQASALDVARETEERLRAALKPFAGEPLSSELGHMKTRLFSFDEFDEKISKARAALAPEGK